MKPVAEVLDDLAQGAVPSATENLLAALRSAPSARPLERSAYQAILRRWLSTRPTNASRLNSDA